MAFPNKNEFEAGDREDEFRTRPFPLESADMEFPDEESPDEDEFAELSEEEMRPFTVAEWKQTFPNYGAEELEEKIPESRRASWMGAVMSCLWGTGFAAAIAGVLVNDQPKPHQLRDFFIFFLVLAPLFSCLWYWFFILRPESIAKKLEDEQANAAGSEPILSNEELRQKDPAGPEPIHPK